ncbi:hypothetical protein [Plebeiibacterium sediminum]|uniref:Uncharacterized protein n=1 Tax=Plebeiibacterium sediminum TaxID=2992112 RepID=A0AAE3SF04_9BACT|nr:hypothetical protein [Plebeiobacterium sediminum]MCW3786960.1 hypothetical protein [Plebeiobacterium sediminum]
MDRTQLSKEDLLYQCSMRINNSINDDAISNAVAQYGYGAEKLQIGKTLLQEAQITSENFTKEYHDVDIAFNERDKMLEQVNDLYYKHWSIAKVVFKDNNAAQVSLDIHGRRAKSASKWFTQTTSFYTNLLSNQNWLDQMNTYGITKESIEEGLAGVNKIQTQNELILREKGDAQQATLIRDHKIDDLYEWVRDYEAIAKIALMDQPQLLEKLGMIIKN